MLTTEKRANYEAVLVDLEGERDGVRQQVRELQGRMRELDNTIATLSKQIGRVLPAPVAQIAQVAQIRPAQSITAYDASQKYARISVRWAILHLLSEKSPMATSDIADTLRECGVVTRAANFTNNVSAVLSTTLKGASEVEMVDGKWQLTDTGRNAIDHIKTGPKFRASCPWVDTPGTSISVMPAQVDRRP